ncbi:hypothetical protein E3P96_01449 [Wallemia ichthyophaga]|nr:hypothetical protein E3P96_01449 [Wallemia ichthyophaga]
MSEINDENQKQEDTVDFEGKGTTPPRPVEQSDNANNLNNLDNLHSNRQQTPHQIDQQGQKDQQDHSDYPASFSHSNQNDNPQGCIVHVSHMHVGVDDQLLTEHMSSSGKVLKVVIMLDPHTRESRGFGFVTFENPSEADDAIEKLHLSQILGKTITVARARRGRPREPTPGQYIGPPKYLKNHAINHTLHQGITGVTTAMIATSAVLHGTQPATTHTMTDMTDMGLTHHLHVTTLLHQKITMAAHHISHIHAAAHHIHSHTNLTSRWDQEIDMMTIDLLEVLQGIIHQDLIHRGTTHQEIFHQEMTLTGHQEDSHQEMIIEMITDPVQRETIRQETTHQETIFQEIILRGTTRHETMMEDSRSIKWVNE